MKKISMRLFVAAALCAGLSAAGFSQNVSWDTAAAGSARLLLPIRQAAARTRAAAAADANIFAEPIDGGASYDDPQEAGAEHAAVLSFRYTCGVARAATCAPYCANGRCDWDFPIVASLETPEGELGRYVADRDFVFPQLSVVDGQVRDGNEVVGTVDPLTKFVVPADGWRIGYTILPSHASICQARGDCPGGGSPSFSVTVFLEKSSAPSACDIRSDRPGCGP